MRIAVITSMKFGLTHFILRDMTALMRKGHHVTLYSLIASPGLYEPDPSWSVVVASRTRAIISLTWLVVRRPVRLLPLLLHAARFRALRNLAVAAQFSKGIGEHDVILSYFGDHKLFVGYYASRITGVPLSVTIRAYELYRNPNPELFRETLGACTLVLTITDHNRRVLEEEFGVPHERIRVIRQIVDLDLFKPSSPVKILIVGFFAEKKGHETLFRSLHLIDEDVEVWVVGERTPSVLPADVRGLARDLGVEDRVAFFGAQRGSALRSLYRECDIFCLPSNVDRKGDHEGFPNVIAEAMAFGKPVVSTRHAGIPEAVDDEFLVDERDAEGLARVLGRLISDPELRRSVGRQNRDRVTTLFSAHNSVLFECALKDAAAQHRSNG